MSPSDKINAQTRRAFLLRSTVFLTLPSLIAGSGNSAMATQERGPERIGFAGNNLIQLILRDTELDVPARIEVEPASKIEWHPDVTDNFGSQGRLNGVRGNFSGNRNLNQPQLFEAWPKVMNGSRLEVFDDSAFASNSTKADDPKYWEISVDGKEVEILSLFRKTVPVRSVAIGERQWANTRSHLLTFVLDRDIAQGSTVTIRSGMPLENKFVRTDKAVSEAIHVCQVGYPVSGPKKAYVGMWFGHDNNGRDGSTDNHLSQQTPWQLCSADTGETVLSGELRLSKAKDEAHRGKKNFNGCDVYVADFSAVRDAGTYRIKIDGVGSSLPFSIESSPYALALRLAARWYFRQRSGIAIAEPFAEGIERPRNSHPEDGLRIVQTKLALGPTSMGYGKLRVHSMLNRSKSTTTNPDAWGGWHDAGDWDRRIQHMEPVFQMANIVELFKSTRDLELNLPESGRTFSDPAVSSKKNERDVGDGETILPDLVHEALWGISLWRRTQREDGAIIGGVEYSTSGTVGSVSWNPVQKIYAFAPDEWSAYWFVLAAAKLGRVIRSVCGDKVLGNSLIREANNAWIWAEQELDSRLSNSEPGVSPDQRAFEIISRIRIAAAATLFRANGSVAARHVFEKYNPFKPQSDANATGAHPGIFAFASFEYVGAAREERDHDPKIVKAIEHWIKWRMNPKRFSTADYGQQRKSAYPWGRGWLRFGPGSNWVARELGLAYANGSADKRDLYNLVTQGMWFNLGCNPSNVSFVKGLGTRQFGDPLNVDLPSGTWIPGQICFGVAGGRLHSWEKKKTAGSIYPFDQSAWPEYCQIFESSSIAICAEHGIKSNAMEWLFACAMVNELGE